MERDKFHAAQHTPEAVFTKMQAEHIGTFMERGGTYENIAFKT